MARRTWLVTVAFALVVACSSFDSVDDATGSDAGPDGGADVATPDDAVAPDAAEADTGADAEVRGCAGDSGTLGHFCDDFDLPGDVGYLWTKKLSSDGGAIGESDAAYSPPRAFVSSFPTGTMVGNAYAWLLKAKDGALAVGGKTRMTLSFRLHVSATTFGAGAPGGGFAHAALITFDNTSCASSSQRAIEVNFTSGNGSSSLAMKGLVTGTCTDAGESDFLAISGPYGIDRFKDGFHRVVVELRREKCPADANGAASVQLTIDDGKTPCQTLGVDPFTMATARLDLNIGLFLGQASGPTTFAYDDVRFDLD